MPDYLCNMCGYPELDEPPYGVTGSPSFEICPCCGGEFGYDDATFYAKINHLRNWVQQGAQWFHPELKPSNWSLQAQLLNIGINLEEL